LSHTHTPARHPFLAASTAALILALALLLPGLAIAHGGSHRGHAAHHQQAKSHSHRHHHHGRGHHGDHGGHHGDDHGHHGEGKRDLNVMTQNLYLGSSLGPALEAQTAEEFVAAVARIYATVQYTNFPQRAEAIADEIQEKDPDLIGLQEVTKWTTGGLNPPPGYDFLAILQSDLEARGLHYTAAAIANNASIGPAPLALAEQGCVQPGPTGPEITCSVQLEDRDVILVNDDTPGLTWSNPQSGRYATQQAIESPVGPLSFDRGWASIDAKLKHQPFRFVDTHLETEESPLVQEAQADEFLAGPGKGGTIVATGDFNSASDGSTTTSYAQLTAPGKFRDAWDEAQLGPGSSCCQESNTPPLAPGALNNPVSTLQTRIDLILSRGAARSSGDEAELIGDTPFQAAPPFWPSDHAGVISTLHLGH
jgi:endonuclease/exonuclease/phosphatase family metal-dependent hydrolase